MYSSAYVDEEDVEENPALRQTVEDSNISAFNKAQRGREASSSAYQRRGRLIVVSNVLPVILSDDLTEA